MEISIIRYYGEQNSRCGYCKGATTSKSCGMTAYKMTAQDYQDLIDRGWRRSGQYCYKPENQSTCCPCYTIKCDALQFQLSKSHKKILKRMTRFLRDGKKDKNEHPEGGGGDANNTAEDGEEVGGIRNEPQAPAGPFPEVNLDAIAAANPALSQHNHSADQATATAASNDGASVADGVPFEQSAVGATDPSLPSSLGSSKQSNESLKPPCKKAKQMRLERRQAKLATKGGSEELVAASPRRLQQLEKTLKDYFDDAQPTDKHKLKIVLVQSSKQSNVSLESYELYRKYQLLVHNDNPQRVSPNSLQRFLYNSPLQLSLLHVGSKEFAATLAESYALYQKYQTRIHNDPPQHLDDYLDFLQRSPLQYTRTQDGPLTGYGSFHQQYWLDDQLIAVAVIDILPSCVSSVYFFYDPDYSFLSLGTYGSLRELQLVRDLAEKRAALKYYYMGFYIHSCPKMRYKGRLVPSQLLCPETYTWHLLTDEMRDKLDRHKYQRLSAGRGVCDANEFHANHLDKVLLLVRQNRMVTYRQYIQSSHIQSIDNMLDIVKSRIYKKITGNDDDRDVLLEYGRLVGRTCAHRMLYVNTGDDD